MTNQLNGHKALKKNNGRQKIDSSLINKIEISYLRARLPGNNSTLVRFFLIWYS